MDYLVQCYHPNCKWVAHPQMCPNGECTPLWFLRGLGCVGSPERGFECPVHSSSRAFQDPHILSQVRMMACENCAYFSVLRWWFHRTNDEMGQKVYDDAEKRWQTYHFQIPTFPLASHQLLTRHFLASPQTTYAPPQRIDLWVTKHGAPVPFHG